MSSYLFLALGSTLLMACSTSTKPLNQTSYEDLESQVFTLGKTDTLKEKFGTVNLFTEAASTFGTKNVTTGVLTILPNNEAHPPHIHAEEEYLLITKGSGTWSLNGKEFPAKTGDLLYASPWDIHGIFNSDTTNLEFYFVKWENKGVESPQRN